MDEGREGIEPYIVAGNYRFRYKEAASNIKKLYYSHHDFGYDGAELHLKDNPSSIDQPVGML
ncbi:hypothetical protein ACQKM9_20085 [Viridibacillus sp. NPDC093762]|uniref:hypothetical protein n=1 Tax=Viridibacillus sp. NPDC093762 TaxID=3390720 RepID=UPI003D078C59